MAIVDPSNNTVPSYGIFRKAGIPVDNTTFAGVALTGALLIDTTNGKLYINTGSQAAPTWALVGDQTA